MSKIIWVFVMVGLLPSIPAFVHILIGAPGETTGAVMGWGFGGISRLTKTMRGRREEGRASGGNQIRTSASVSTVGAGESMSSSMQSAQQANSISNIGKGLRSIVDTPFTPDGLKQMGVSVAKAGVKGVIRGTGTALVGGVGAMVTATTGNAELGFATVGSGLKGLERIRQNPVVQSTGQAVKQWGMDQISRLMGESRTYSSSGKSYSELSLEMQAQFGNATNWMNRLAGDQVSSAYHASPKREPETTGTTSVRRAGRGLDQQAYRYVPYEEQMRKLIQAQNRNEMRQGTMSPTTPSMNVNPVEVTVKENASNYGEGVNTSPPAGVERMAASYKEPVGLRNGADIDQGTLSTRPQVSPYTNQPMIPYKPKGTDYTSQVLSDPYGVVRRDERYRKESTSSPLENRHRQTQTVSAGQAKQAHINQNAGLSIRPSQKQSNSNPRRVKHEESHENHLKMPNSIPFNASAFSNFGKPPTKK